MTRPPAVCARCGCLCDDIALRHEGGCIDAATNACDRGADWLEGLPPPASASFQKGGSPLPLGEAVALAAKRLEGAGAPARILGLRNKGHLGPGADADIAIYDDAADRLRMFESPPWVVKDGEILVEDGKLRKAPEGRMLRIRLERFERAAREIEERRSIRSRCHPRQHGLSDGERAALATVEGGK